MKSIKQATNEVLLVAALFLFLPEPEPEQATSKLTSKSQRSFPNKFF
jgi:hypothetical protein